MRETFCPKNQYTKIIGNFGRGYPQTFEVKLIPKTQQKISGTFQENRYFWIFPQTPITGRLETHMSFDRYWINGIYSVYIKPDCDLMAQVR